MLNYLLEEIFSALCISYKTFKISFRDQIRTEYIRRYEYYVCSNVSKYDYTEINHLAKWLSPKDPKDPARM
jgi:hypothetical protein